MAIKRFCNAQRGLFATFLTTISTLSFHPQVCAQAMQTAAPSSQAESVAGSAQVPKLAIRKKVLKVDRSLGRSGQSSMRGGQDIGGGSQCLANFMRSAYEVSQALDRVGLKLKPKPIRGDEFLDSIDTSAIRETTEDLRYVGNPVDAYFNGSVILVRCDRLADDSRDGRRMVVAHELFRNMHLEGDRYELSRQIFAASAFQAVSHQETEDQAMREQEDHVGGRCSLTGALLNDGYALINENGQVFGPMSYAKVQQWAQGALQEGRCHSITDLTDIGFKPDSSIRALCPDDPKPTRARDVWQQISPEIQKRLRVGKFSDLEPLTSKMEYRSQFMYGLVRYHACMTQELFSIHMTDQQRNDLTVQVQTLCQQNLDERSGRFLGWSCTVQDVLDTKGQVLPRVLNAAGKTIGVLTKN